MAANPASKTATNGAIGHFYWEVFGTSYKFTHQNFSNPFTAAQDAANPGVLILSRFAGAAAEFKEGALLVNPYDPDQVAAAIARAVAMPQAERKSRHAALYRVLLSNDISGWGDKFLASLMGDKKFTLKSAPSSRH